MWVIGGPLDSRLLFQSSGEFEVECVCGLLGVLWFPDYYFRAQVSSR